MVRRDDCSPGVDNELPRIGVMEYRTGRSPYDDDEYCEQKGDRPPRLMGGSSRDVGEDVLHIRRKRTQETLFPNPDAAPCRFQSSGIGRKSKIRMRRLRRRLRPPTRRFFLCGLTALLRSAQASCVKWLCSIPPAKPQGRYRAAPHWG